VLQRIFLPLLLVKAGVFVLIRIAHRLKQPPALMVLSALHAGSTRTPVSSITPRALYYQQAAFKTLKRKQPGRSHQSQAMIANSSGRDCRYKKCPGFDKPRKRPRSYPTRYRCEECTQEKGIAFGYVIQLRMLMVSKPYSIAMQSTMWKGNYSSTLLVMLVVKVVSFLI
jgi:hypothetical protein